MSRRELHSLVRNLRQYLEWQAAPLAATVPADEDARTAVETAIRERQRAALARTLEPNPEPSRAAAPPSRPAEPREAPPRPSFMSSNDSKNDPPPPAATPALWKDDTLGASPRRTFAPQKPKDPPPARAQAQAAKVETLEEIRADMGDCKRCGLCEERKNIVFGVGSPTARLMFIGEGPGFNEDVQGEPFVGAAGELLDKMIKAMTLSREQVYIANVVKCRPPNNRDPASDEVAKCGPFLKRQIRSIKPEVIVTVGKFSSNLLSGNDGSLTRIRGQWQEWNGIPVMPTYHPAYLLRKPQDKGKAWDDLKQVMERLDLHIPEKYR